MKTRHTAAPAQARNVTTGSALMASEFITPHQDVCSKIDAAPKVIPSGAKLKAKEPLLTGTD